MRHYWQGELIDDAAALGRLGDIEQRVQRVLAEPMNTLAVLAAGERLSAALAQADHPVRPRLIARLRAAGLDQETAAQVLGELAGAFRRETLERKLVRELGNVLPERLARFDFREAIFEAWAPLGLVAHVSPGNAPAAGALSALEGLLTGNVNIVKASSGDGGFTQELLALLAAMDQTGALTRRLIVLNFSAAQSDWLAAMCAHADAVAAWGGEEALESVRAVLRPGARLVDWGPKLSFAYLTSTGPEVLAKVAHDVCQLDQLACSSPQVIYLDTDDPQAVADLAKRFGEVLAEKVAATPIGEPNQAEWAEITSTVLVAQLEEYLGLTRVYSALDGGWRVLADVRGGLCASPLHRTVWVKPLPRTEIITALRPMRQYLQTVGLGADQSEVAELSRLLLTAGVHRVTVPGAMLDSYAGEPHDGVYALPRYARRVDVQLDERFATHACLDDLLGAEPLAVPAVRVTGKADFEALQQGSSRAEVFFRSGGSSGEPKLSMFSWADYHEHTRAGAEGLLAAGFDPRTDCAMNLLFAGQLYGGFTSIFSTLETLGAVQYPMAAPDDHAGVARQIVDLGVDTLVGMPNYLLRIFTEGAEVLRGYQGVRKIFFSGEHFPRRQRRRLAEEFGVQVIRSAVYGSVDAGPLGYQCRHAEDRVHHLFTGTQTLEILAMDEDRAVERGETGRLVFTSHTRRGQRLDRYEIGDLGRWVPGDCPCGRRTTRFELLGRFGDVFRAGTYFLNCRRLVTIAEECADYAGELQVVLDADRGGDTVAVLVEKDRALSTETLEKAFLAEYPELRSAVRAERLLKFAVHAVPASEFTRTEGSGKLRAVVDLRTGKDAG
ncbi:acyl-CoA reductase [Amycolatopsis sp. SID8362]|uniref:acyl-CoA reductase n=1 Tax=Amycolatopsis sp. SID8362 TaxID=2690346 RepID=UPI00136C5CD3|nr:acyl-CoA reductase [Amycolatopsis sp. SID8362]NBH03506.1 hypothetical protein [Amycolatopsis sp. SID8362]NED40206.1 hypothetical protein [Amycolatopsis sp. SID8362]